MGISNMALHGILAWLIVGTIAGWLAGQFVKGSGFGLLVDMLVGVAGAVIGGWLAALLGVNASGGWLVSIITATVGAVMLLFVIRAAKRA
jgi:uncharacterized membrane protein YeaQ/YmgE (transglycosylase-associated protein family)